MGVWDVLQRMADYAEKASTGKNGLRYIVQSFDGDMCKAKVENVGINKYKNIVIDAVFKDRNGNVVDRGNHIIYDILPPRESRPFFVSTLATDAYSVSLSIRRFEEIGR